MLAAASMHVRIWPASLPPPVASNASVAPVATIAFVKSSAKVGRDEFTICLAPRLRSVSACSGLRTTFTKGTASAMQTLFSICPRLEAAAVWISALWPSARMVSTMPNTVRGFTNQDAHSAGVTPSGKGRQVIASSFLYCEYVPPPITPTTFPSRACAASDVPAFTTTPAPSLPAGSDWPTRAFRLGIRLAGMLAETTGLAAVPPTSWRVLMSAGPNRRPKSLGFMGAASMRTTTSCGFGSGMGTLTRDSSTEFPSLTSVRS
mmetsp:Transcript_33378/g.95880  ORF Transcript_33378/g.95880 Transcript_33378/m.95880 type:complete len:262 (-) Transcript_33378:66-851(-)